MTMCELVTYSIIQRFTPHFFQKTNNAHHTTVFAVFSKIGFFAIIYILIYILKKQQKYDRQNDKSGFNYLILKNH